MLPEFHLTPEEEALVVNSQWLLTKQRVIGKVYGLFGLVSQECSGILESYHSFIPAEVTATPPKIYKGEMYRQLPYVMLDQPRCFNESDVFAIRHLFWWGNHFSIHLVLSGKYRDQFGEALNQHIQEGALDSWYVGISEDPWEHHFEDDNYQPIHTYRSHHKLLPDVPYLKIARWHPLDEWRDAYSFYISSFTQIVECTVQ